MPELAATPGQTVGPFFHYALPYPGDRELVRRGTPGSVWLHGYVYDGNGNAVPDALLEIRQADAHGVVPRVEGSVRRDGAGFTGWGRSSTDPTGHYWFSTVEPGPVGHAAPFFAVTVFARGLLDRLFTRIYLPGDLTTDPLLSGLDEDDRTTLVAVREADGSLRFDVRLQGPGETVFLTYPRHS
ncbi:protocatechuate 3,4-dioxygenase alpha subunit [Kribbella antiqua]|uniref:Protocatechuate 3,4-dioxygenase alpha subunit n=1 Tax=Kribbella antiqua TaxID=2512217 RepID=A0A4R2IWX7_9ACTN|nr:protocatechuate 3,4-dioxygenase subunit alpha [Kribbella antiqua]TCO50293.1 protocatechuate 3,4-dioxygenase alpha subunit [Kribbella antiqua]